MRSNVYRKLLTLDRIENYTFIRGREGGKYFASAGERTLHVQKIGDVSIERSITRPCGHRTRIEETINASQSSKVRNSRFRSAIPGRWYEEFQHVINSIIVALLSPRGN